MHERIRARLAWDPTAAALLKEREQLVDSARVRGFLIEDALDLVRESGAAGAPARGTYRAFASYPAYEYFDALVWAADAAFASSPLRDGIRRVSRRGFLAIARTVPGRIIFGAVARDIEHAVRLVARAYELAGASVSATVLDVGDHHAQLRLNPIFCLVDSAVAGGFDGLFEAYGCTGSVSVTAQEEDAVLIELRWQRAPHEEAQAEHA